MKKLLSIFLLLGAMNTFAYTEWQEYTPRVIYSHANLYQYLITKKLVIRTKGMINSCSGLFEGNRYRVKVLDCSETKLNLKIEYINKVDCDQGMTIEKKLKVKIPKGCEFNEWQDGVIIINGKEFQDH